jgi:hypothetical protein
VFEKNIMLTKSCLAGITFFEMAAFISHLYSMMPGGYGGEKKNPVRSLCMV